MATFSYERYERRRQNTRTTFGYWVPLVITATLAAGGLAAWVWSAREDDSSSSDEDTDLSYGDKDAVSQPHGGPPSYRSQDQGVHRSQEHDESLLARMSGAIRRTPSPQQAFDMAKKNVVAGVAAAGAIVGGALGSIREEERDDFGDHARWAEQRALQKGVAATSGQSTGAVATNTDAFSASVRGQTSKGGRKKTVAVVLSAESALDDLHEEAGNYRTEHASILSHLPPSATSTSLLILIYTPTKSPSKPSSRRASIHGSLTSSYSAISTPAQTPGEELQSLDPRPDYTPGTTPALSATHPETSAYKDLQTAALKLVSDETHVMPFSTATGHIHMLRHLAPEVVYMTESLAGPGGENVLQLRDWVGQIVVVVGGDGSGLGGLVDTEDESDGAKGKQKEEKWWQSSEIVGLGKRVEVVEGVRMAEDFERRVGGRE